MHLPKLPLLLFAVLSAPVSALWPEPLYNVNGTDTLFLAPTLKTSYISMTSENSHNELERIFKHDTSPSSVGSAGLPSSPAISETQLIHDALARFHALVHETAYVPWKFHPRGDTSYEPNVTSSSKKAYLHQITVQQVARNTSVPMNDTDESYTLNVTSSGLATIHAASARGAMYALTTLSQFFFKHSSSSYIYTSSTPILVRDTPTYAHRGLNMDISRNWIPPSSAKRIIDGMALTKLNTLHIHATDAQSWPLEIPSMPELSAKGAYSPHRVWSVSALDDVMSYAYARGIQTNIEIDSPGHMSSVAYSRPELINAFNIQPWGNYCAEPPCGEIKLGSENTTSFFNTLYGDLLPRVAPYTTTFHSGGDEVNANVYALDPVVNSSSPAVIQPYLSSLVSHLHDLITSAGLTQTVWEEMILQWNVSVAPSSSIVVQTWQPGSLAAVTAKGYTALFGEYDFWYLDCGFGQWLNPNTSNSQTPIVPPYTDYCTPYKSWREVYAYNPLTNLTATQASLLKGGEVHIWGELTDPINLDGKVWPRAAAAAEVMWRGPSGVPGVDEGVSRRLGDFRERIVGLGIASSAVQMEWCFMNLGSCTL